MPTEPAQLALALFEVCLLLSGAGLVLWLVFNRTARTRWLGTNALPATATKLPDLILCAGLIFLTGFSCQAVVQLSLGSVIARARDHQGIALFAYSVPNYAGAFLAWRFLFPSLHRSWRVEPDAPTLFPTLRRNWLATPVVAAAPVPALPWSKALRYAAGTLLVALPLLSGISLGWNFLVEKMNLSNVPQDVIAIFTSTRSPLVVTGMLLVACVLAPIYEEMLFRAGLYRFCRQKLGRGWALVISGVCFGALHGNWAGFVPLAMLGMGLALAYEATGSIRVPIIAHGLFNLNTVLILLSGLKDLAT
ncbi:CPBP family intramembrane glutamic endopeptidase [Opitutus sp. GAS368]|uniref:CPBP family intramembrane glutamic endopeptidase n=1 Tax=Opitutus sp. GAS368 TaxID=1882749 RepID=UPI00087A52D6|nr:CPBP family intramembrane glutamic endopeptidase [Opitutus sp. GAS368]SDR65745.1 Membrane protease YdiL, CAAX protease family [Opitutus sp. GAS368]